jgi:hypothetical protein
VRPDTEWVGVISAAAAMGASGELERTIRRIQEDALRHGADICELERQKFSMEAGLGATPYQVGKIDGAEFCKNSLVMVAAGLVGRPVIGDALNPEFKKTV